MKHRTGAAYALLALCLPVLAGYGRQRAQLLEQRHEIAQLKFRNANQCETIAADSDYIDFLRARLARHEPASLIDSREPSWRHWFRQEMARESAARTARGDAEALQRLHRGKQ